jgi:hypothetical protein
MGRSPTEPMSASPRSGLARELVSYPFGLDGAATICSGAFPWMQEGEIGPLEGCYAGDHEASVLLLDRPCRALVRNSACFSVHV